jgi:isochorismate pyruvate lyase
MKPAAPPAQWLALLPVVPCATMPDVRSQIDALDDVLVPLLAQRIGYMSQAARIKQDVKHVRDEARIQAIVDRVRKKALQENGEPDVVEAIYRGMMEACIAFEHREFARLRAVATVEVSTP